MLVVEYKTGMLMIAGLILGQVKIFLVEVIENIFLNSTELGEDVLRYTT